MGTTSWWLVTDFDHTTGGVVTARWVQAATAEQAGYAALTDLEADWERTSDGERLTTIFAMRVEERVALDVVSTTRRSELQCCGGIGNGRHSALCEAAGSTGEQAER